jgi:hypothetical protein
MHKKLSLLIFVISQNYISSCSKMHDCINLLINFDQSLFGELCIFYIRSSQPFGTYVRYGLILSWFYMLFTPCKLLAYPRLRITVVYNWKGEGLCINGNILDRYITLRTFLISTIWVFPVNIFNFWLFPIETYRNNKLRRPLKYELYL